MSLEFSPSDDGSTREDLFGVLTDDACREIIAALERPLTVPEIAEEADRPLSTTYRKLDRLTEAGLIKETVGVRSGRHERARYVADFDRVAVALDDERSLRVTIERSSEYSLELWDREE